MNTATNVAREIAKNVAMGIKPVAEWRINRPRVGAQTISAASLDRYAFQMVRELEARIGSLTGKDIVEFGPGDTLGAGLVCLAAGARSYAALDRFVPNYASDSAREWYRAIHEAWPTSFPGRPWPDDLDPSQFPERYPERVKHTDGGVEGAKQSETYDIVSSWQVGEHVEDVSAFCSLTASLLRPGGVAVHRVDFGPHDCWRESPDARRFLRFPEPVWRAMGSNRAYPNRVRHATFVKFFAAAGLNVEVAEVSLFDADAGATSENVRDAVYVCRPKALT